MKHFEWDEVKNDWLKDTRGVSFEDAVSAITNENLLVTIDNPNKVRYPNQKVYIIEIHEYAYIVPFVEDEKKRFLKTIIPSRKMTKKYLKKEK